MKHKSNDIAIETNSESYGLNWFGKSECMKIIQKPSVATLEPDRSESVVFDNTDNVYIEGENLEVLKLLQESYFSKIKMIYIDPPYNTGKDFIYNDKFGQTIDAYQKMTGQVDASGRKHTNWLNMMYPRLYLARNLLRDDGVIFISIDDHEVANLKAICDQIFGDENFIGAFTKKTGGGKNDSKYIKKDLEYLYCYRKTDSATINLNTITRIDKNTLTTLQKWGDTERREDRPNLWYPIYADPKTGMLSLDKNGEMIAIYPIKNDGTQRRWRWNKKKVRDNIHKLELSQKVDKFNVIKYDIKVRNSDITCQLPWSSFIQNFSTCGGKELKNLMGQKFPGMYPKSNEYMKWIVSLLTHASGQDIILDFFSGSATTAHAVMQLNAEDNGNRKYIMVQLPEPTPEHSEARNAGYLTIADIGKERIRRAAKKIKEAYPEKSNLDLGFKVFKTKAVN